MGRADQTTKVRGMFVRPSQIAEVAKRHGEIVKARLVVGQKDRLDVATLSCEVKGEAAPALAQAIAESFHAIAKVRAAVKLTAPGSLPNDGKVIEDARTYE
jgi:phenylacetate-CoA ligase